MYSHDKRDQGVHELFLKQVKQGIGLADHIKEVHLRGSPWVRKRNGWGIKIGIFNMKSLILKLTAFQTIIFAPFTMK